MKTLKIIIQIMYNAIFFLLILSASFILLTTYNIIKGYNFYVVMSGSMEPTIPTGSVVGIKEENEYNINEIITVRMKNDPSQTYTHRIIQKDSTTEVTYITKGDANETADPDKVTEELVKGRVFISLPVIGYVVNFAKQPTGFILMIILPSIVIAASELNVIKREVVKLISKKKENED